MAANDVCDACNAKYTVRFVRFHIIIVYCNVRPVRDFNFVPDQPLLALICLDRIRVARVERNSSCRLPRHQDYHRSAWFATWGRYVRVRCTSYYATMYRVCLAQLNFTSKAVFFKK